MSLDRLLSSVQLPECLAGNEDDSEEFNGFTLDSVCDSIAVDTSKSVAEVWTELFGDSDEEEEFSGFDLRSMYDCYSLVLRYTVHTDSLNCSGPLPSFQSTTRRAGTQQSYQDDDISEDDEYYCKC